VGIKDSGMSRKIGDIYYEWAHKNCHPETCSCREDYRIIEYPCTVDWAATEAEAKKLGISEKAYEIQRQRKEQRSRI
jgi:hypothetical protein